jgi:hypothetical protein
MYVICYTPILIVTNPLAANAADRGLRTAGKRFEGYICPGDAQGSWSITRNTARAFDFSHQEEVCRALNYFKDEGEDLIYEFVTELPNPAH